MTNQEYSPTPLLQETVMQAWNILSNLINNNREDHHKYMFSNYSRVQRSNEGESNIMYI